MGCGQSKIENEEAVTRCKDRTKFIKDAVSYRNAFAAAHSAYSIALKNTGAALSDYAQGEVHLISSTATPSSHHHHLQQPQSTSASAAVPSTSAAPIDAPLPPPPPPISDFQAPLQRAASMPEIPPPKKNHLKIPADSTIQEDEGDGGDGDGEDDREGKKSEVKNSVTAGAPPPAAPPGEGNWFGQYIFDTANMPGPSLSQPEAEVGPPPPPPPVSSEIPKKKEEKVEQAAAPPLPPKPVKKQKAAGRVAPNTGPRINLLQVLKEVDDHFLHAYECAHEVSKMLEATRMHYHSNFADNRGHIDHSARVMRVITWNRSCKGLKDEEGDKDDFDNEESETHATVLDKMLAWEKKLCDEVKAGELMKIEYQRKVSQLNKQKKRGASSETLEKTKAAVSHLHTRYIVDMQSMDSTVSEINRLRDKQLYPKLVDLVDGMAIMWETMHIHHLAQLKIVGYLKNLDLSVSPKETIDQHNKATVQLWHVVLEWHSQFQKLMSNQKLYIQALNNWLKLNLIPIESNLKEKMVFPPSLDRVQIQPLIHAWHDMLEKLSDDLAKSAIFNFSEVVHTILMIQEDELKLKEKCEDSRREYLRKSRAFEDWYHRYMEKKAAMADAAAPTEEDSAVADEDPETRRTQDEDEMVVERRALVESLKIKLADDEESYRRICKQVREKSIGSLRTHLPELFRAMRDFSQACSEMYKNLRSITMTRSQSREEEEAS